MSDATAIHCPNCQTTNATANRFCQHCGVVLPKRYLWAVGKPAAKFQPGQWIDDRYRVIQSRILLDTQPGELPIFSPVLSRLAQSYLRLVPYRLHIPQPYGCLSMAQTTAGGEVLLLEMAPIVDSGPMTGSLLPELTSQWGGASGLRQLHWLWQIAQLWQPLQAEHAATSLLTPGVLRVEPGWVRLLELVLDPAHSSPTLVQLGQGWTAWAATAHPTIASFLTQVCQALVHEEIQTIAQLVLALDYGLCALGKFQTRQVQVCTLSDQGPSRQRNEDACYPPSGSSVTYQASSGLLTIVCDGIGGHEGGDIASCLAITTLETQLKTLELDARHDYPAQLVERLEAATLVTNDQINQRNNQQHKSERQRMGTTLLIAVLHNHELYLTHVGDSRAYQITRQSCHQITLDDDYATREVRLGNAFYRDVLQHYSSGALVQALGIVGSTVLHPTTRPFVLEEDCVFLLCSDGLSDNDRVEDHWQAEIVPILEGKVDLAIATQRLVEIANTQNGHDNVTVALLYCRVTENHPEPLPALSFDQLSIPTVSTLARRGTATDAALPNTRLKTQVAASPSPSRHSWLGIVLAAALGITLAVITAPLIRVWLALSDLVTDPSPSGTPDSPDPLLINDLSSGSFIQALTPLQLTSEAELASDRAADALPNSVITIPAGSILKILKKQTKRANDRSSTWLELQMCELSSPDSAQTSPQNSTPTPSPIASPSPENRIARYRGWILDTDLQGKGRPIAAPSPALSCLGSASPP